MPSRLRLVILRLGGVLLVVLGALHLVVTPLIARLLQRGMSPDAAEWLTPPMLLNHVVVGILLLPLGALTAYAAPHAARGERWALIVAYAPEKVRKALARVGAAAKKLSLD